jgi:hypothetical protein
VPLIQALNRQADDWGATELGRARKLLARGEPVENVLEALARGLTHKMLHGTLAELHAADGDDRARLADTLYALDLLIVLTWTQDRDPARAATQEIIAATSSLLSFAGAMLATPIGSALLAQAASIASKLQIGRAPPAAEPCASPQPVPPVPPSGPAELGSLPRARAKRTGQRREL